MAIVSGAEILEGPHDWAGKFIPLVPVWGDLVNIEGQEKYSGMVRFSRDAQQVYNFHRTLAIEAVANAPKAPFMVTPEQIKGFEAIWKASSSENFPYLPFNNVQGQPPPQRARPPDVPVSLIELARLDNDDLKAVNGQFDASLGKQSNETSGKAILARQREGDTATYSYLDNLSRAIKFTGEILVDLIPKIYDTPRAIRILGEDGKEDWAHLYHEEMT